MMIRFATVCDKPECGIKSAEYEAFPTCRDCLQHICPGHRILEEDDPETNRTLCLDCRIARSQDAPEESQ